MFFSPDPDLEGRIGDQFSPYAPDFGILVELLVRDGYKVGDCKKISVAIESFRV